MSVKSGQFQIIGDQQKLGKKPLSSPSSDPASGMFQLVGDNVQMSRKAISSPSANPHSGMFQLVGDSTSLNHKPVKGWGTAASLPISNRAVAASKLPFQKGKGKK